MDISNYLKAGYPALYITTLEPLRATKTLNTTGWQCFCWDCLRGITQRDSEKIIEDVIDPLGAIKWLGSQNDTVLLVQNFHHFVSSVEIIQEIQNSLVIWKASGCWPGELPMISIIFWPSFWGMRIWHMKNCRPWHRPARV